MWVHSAMTIALCWHLSKCWKHINRCDTEQWRDFLTAVFVVNIQPKRVPSEQNLRVKLNVGREIVVKYWRTYYVDLFKPFYASFHLVMPHSCPQAAFVWSSHQRRFLLSPSIARSTSLGMHQFVLLLVMRRGEQCSLLISWVEGLLKPNWTTWWFRKKKLVSVPSWTFM